MKLRELHAALRYRPRGRDALDGTVNEPAAFFRLVPFDENFGRWCLHEVTVMLVDSSMYLPAMDVLLNPEDDRPGTWNQMTTTQRRN